MKSIRDEIHELIDAIPDEVLVEVKLELERIRFESLIPTVIPTKEELEQIEKAEKEIANGEYYTYEQVFGKGGILEDKT